MAYADQLYHELESNLATLLLQIVFILALCRVVGYALLPLKQPPVSGEIIAGVIMGPSVMGQSKLFADFMFPPRNTVLLKGISDLGVVMFMFILGLEFSPSEMFKSLKKTWMIGVAGIVLPFALGAAIAQYLYDECGMANEEHQVSVTAFILFVGASMSFTAFPVLARILTANDAMTAQIGLVSMGVASVDDVLAWTVLAVATSYTGGGKPQDGAWGILLSIAWVTVLLGIVKPLLKRLQCVVSENNFIVVVFMGMCISAWFTQVIGLHAFFGAFCFGIAVPKDDQVFVLKFIDQLEVVVVNFFVPLFFANTGLHTDLTTLSSGAGPVLLVWVLASVGKMAPAFFLGKCRGYSWRFSFQLASLMNARGLIALIALEMARDVNAFNTQVSSVFVIMALLTTLMAGPMFYFSYRPSTDPPRPIGVTECPAPDTCPAADPDVVQEDNYKCSEIPVTEQMDLTAGSYGYLYQRTLYRQQQAAERARTSVMDVFGLHRQHSHPEHVNPSTQTVHGHLKHPTPHFDSLRSTHTYPAPKKEKKPAPSPLINTWAEQDPSHEGSHRASSPPSKATKTTNLSPKSPNQTSVDRLLSKDPSVSHVPSHTPKTAPASATPLLSDSAASTIPVDSTTHDPVSGSSRKRHAISPCSSPRGSLPPRPLND